MIDPASATTVDKLIAFVEGDPGLDDNRLNLPTLPTVIFPRIATAVVPRIPRIMPNAKHGLCMWHKLDRNPRDPEDASFENSGGDDAFSLDDAESAEGPTGNLKAAAAQLGFSKNQISARQSQYLVPSQTVKAVEPVAAETGAAVDCRRPDRPGDAASSLGGQMGESEAKKD